VEIHSPLEWSRIVLTPILPSAAATGIWITLNPFFDSGPLIDSQIAGNDAYRDLKNGFVESITAGFISPCACDSAAASAAMLSDFIFLSFSSVAAAVAGALALALAVAAAGALAVALAVAAAVAAAVAVAVAVVYIFHFFTAWIARMAFSVQGIISITFSISCPFVSPSQRSCSRCECTHDR
jgi:hypothetical protein